jgi:hypothetical protein
VRRLRVWLDASQALWPYRGSPRDHYNESPRQELTDRPAIAGNGKRGPVP